MALKEVKCPNLCDNGQLKHYPTQNIALWVYVKCPYCKGVGKVSELKAKEIESEL